MYRDTCSFAYFSYVPLFLDDFVDEESLNSESSASGCCLAFV